MIAIIARCIVDSIIIAALGYAYIKYIAIPIALEVKRSGNNRRELIEIKTHKWWGIRYD